MGVASAWSHGFNNACQSHPGPQFPGLYADVMAAVVAARGVEAATLFASPVHGFGLVHQLVEAARAGWVRNWVDIAREHQTRRPPVDAPVTQTTPSAQQLPAQGAQGMGDPRHDDPPLGQETATERLPSAADAGTAQSVARPGENRGRSDGDGSVS
jgi:hypothetical protein